MITRRPSAATLLGVAELDPVHLRVGKQAVEQDHRPALAGFVPRELDPVGSGPELGRGFAHRRQMSAAGADCKLG